MKHAMAACLTLSLLPLTGPLAAQTIIVEALSGNSILSYCDEVHVTMTCNYKHVFNVVAVTTGSTLQLDDGNYFVEWMGPGYYLATGVVVEPLGETTPDLKGQLWLEVYPDQGKTHTSREWADHDGNRALSASDTLALDSDPPVMVKDVRLQLRVKPAAAP